MNKPTRTDLTTIEGDPGLRADMQLELEADELMARRLRSQVRIEHQMTAYPSAHQTGIHRPASREGPIFAGGHPGNTPPPPAGPPPTDCAVHRSILAIDIEGSTKRTNSVKAQLRRTMYDLLETALSAAGIGEHVRDQLIDRGDSALALIHPVDQAPKTLLLDTVVPTLIELLVDHNHRSPESAFRLRVVIHAGEVHYDGRGWFGEALDLACRLLDAPEVKRRLFRSAGPLVLVVSESIYWSIVRQGYDGIGQDFESAVRVRVGDHRHQGWVQASGQVAGDSVQCEATCLHDRQHRADEPASGIA